MDVRPEYMSSDIQFLLKTRPVLFSPLNNKTNNKKLCSCSGIIYLLLWRFKCNLKKIPQMKGTPKWSRRAATSFVIHILPFQCSRGKRTIVHYQKMDSMFFKHLYTATHTHVCILNHYLNREPSSQRRICNLKTEVRFKMASLKSFSIW